MAIPLAEPSRGRAGERSRDHRAGRERASREIIVAWVGRRRRDRWEDACEDYRKRIARMRSVRDLPIRVKAAPDDPHRRQAEGEAILAALPDPCWLIALDESGRQRTSRGLSSQLARLNADWPHAVAFVIGSDIGLAQEVRHAAREVLSLGRLTLSHDLARVVIYEQIYRALSIEAGIKYHRGPL